MRPRKLAESLAGRAQARVIPKKAILCGARMSTQALAKDGLLLPWLPAVWCGSE